MTSDLLAQVEAVLAEDPTLSRHGFGNRDDNYRMPVADDAHSAGRMWFTDAKGLDEIAACVAWLEAEECAEGDSYKLKHMAEESEFAAGCHGYLPNGAMLLAAILTDRLGKRTGTNAEVVKAAGAECPTVVRRGRRAA